MEIYRHVGDYKKFLLYLLEKNDKGKKHIHTQKILRQVFWNCFLSEIQLKITN